MKLKETKLIQYRKIDYGIISGSLHCIISGGMSTSHGSGSKETSMFISFIQENNVNISDNFSFVFQSRWIIFQVLLQYFSNVIEIYSFILQ